MSLKYEPASEPQVVSLLMFFFNHCITPVFIFFFFLITPKPGVK